MVKMLAMYLPQFHEIEQNNEWWGKGYTEWTNLKKAEKLYPGQYQPRIPLYENYYDLTDETVMEQQSALARSYGIYGFCFYHYWFEGIQLMEKPVNALLYNPRIQIPFCFSWANHTWTKCPGKKGKLLIRQTYGEKEDWEKHFQYLNSFFQDERYIKVNNKPMLVIYNPSDIGCWKEMKSCWNYLAKKAGWSGIHYVATLKAERDIEASVSGGYDAQFEYQPTFGLRRLKKIDYAFWYQLKYTIINLKFLHRVSVFHYDKIWKQIMKKSCDNGITTYLGAFTDWDTTARWGKKGSVFHGANPEKFKKYLQIQCNRSEKLNQSEFLFITAWNEWSEGAYLEPDEKYRYAYLEAVAEVSGIHKEKGNERIPV